MPPPGPFDTPQQLPISWSFLLAQLLPSFFIKLLGLHDSVPTVNEGTWTGSKIFFDPNTSHSKLKLREVNAGVLANALRAVKKHDAKLTGTLQQMIARALSRVITDTNIDNFFSQTAMNMRGAVGIPENEGGNYAAVCSIVHPRQAASDRFSDVEWAAAKFSTQKLAESAVNLQDHTIGLLRYLPSIRKWTFSKIGQRRGCSFEVSNMGIFKVS
jgi:hypothetical protein